LIGNGFLREPPRPVAYNAWDLKSKSALRKCMFMPVPEQLRGMFPQVLSASPAALAPRPSPPVIAAADVAPHRRDPQKDARAFPAFPGVADPRAVAAEAHALRVREAQRAAVAAALSPRLAAGAWWEDPLALGSLLILVPPIGLAAVWSSKRYSSDARWALTVMTALTMCLMSAIVIAVLTLR
jgi:hypothetical protein